jgi:hypothetical protein
MNPETDLKTMAGSTIIQHSGDHAEPVPMHPDDSEALLAWITAKRFHERVLNETFAEQPVFPHIG